MDISWFFSFKIFFFFLESFVYSDFFVFIGFFYDLESVYNLKFFLNSMGFSNFFFEKFVYGFLDFRFFFLLNLSILKLEDLFFSFFLFLDLRFDSPLLFNRVRKSFLSIAMIFLLLF